MVSKMFASVCTCKKSKRRSTSLLLNGLSPGISKGMFLCIITAQVFSKEGGQPLLIHCGLELAAYSKIMLCERCYGL